MTTTCDHCGGRTCPQCGSAVTDREATYCSCRCAVIAANATKKSKAAQERAKFAEDVQDLIDHGATTHDVIRWAGRTPPAIEQRLRRAGRPDLARPFAVLRRRAERARAA